MQRRRSRIGEAKALRHCDPYRNGTKGLHDLPVSGYFSTDADD